VKTGILEKIIFNRKKAAAFHKRSSGGFPAEGKSRPA
jgi:hypothetical protein